MTSDSFFVTLITFTKEGNTIFRCVKYNKNNLDHCGGYGYLDFEPDTIRITVQHTCQPPDIELHKLQRRIYNQAEDTSNSDKNSRDIFDAECRKVERELAVKLTYKNVQANMSRRKASAFPKTPESFQDLVSGMEQHQETLGKNFKASLELNGEVFGVIWADDYLLEQIPEKSHLSQWDGTFRVVPKIGYQLFTIMGMIGHHSFPILTSLLDGKSEEKYIILFEKLHELAPTLEIREAMSDFELASRNACEAVFENATVHHCSFHFSQCLFKKVLVIGGSKLYDENQEFNHWIRHLMAIDLLPADLIFGMMNELLSKEFSGLTTAEKLVVKKFKSYFRRQWLNYDKGNLSVYGMDSATNNGCESFHSMLGRKFPGKKPSVWNFVTKISDILQDKSIECQRLILHGPGSITRERRKKVAQNIERRRNAEYELQTGQISTKDFLAKVSHTFDTQVRDLQRRYQIDPDHLEFQIDDVEEDLEEENANVDIPLANNNAPMCAICWGPQGEIIIALVPCGHRRFCASCVGRICNPGDSCPICRVAIRETVRLF